MHNETAHDSLSSVQPNPGQWLAPFKQLSQFIYWTRCSVVRNIPLASSAHLSWLCCLPASGVPPPGKAGETGKFLTEGQCQVVPTEKKKKGVLSAFSSWIQNTTLYRLLGRNLTESQQNPGHIGTLHPFPTAMQNQLTLSLQAGLKDSKPSFSMLSAPKGNWNCDWKE